MHLKLNTAAGLRLYQFHAEVQLRALPFRRDCYVNKILSVLDRREQYRQTVLIVERGDHGFQPLQSVQ